MSDLDLITAAAEAAGELAAGMLGRDLGIERKSDGTPVTDADLAVDRFLRERLLEARPDYGWLSEETADDPARLDRRRVFIVDPIDGTRAFIRGRPWWSISIAVVEAGEPRAGVVRAPALAATWRAARGGGATRNGAPVRCSDRTSLEDCRMLSDAALLRRPTWSPPWPPMRLEARNSVALRLALVADGEFDAALALTHKGEWDLAAGCLIAHEAGALATDHQGRPFRFNQPLARAPSLLAAGPGLYPLILERVSPIELPPSAAPTDDV